jgi:catechol 2,3-dioxygenase-like lactoylglutathione lyase family enzyme
VARLVGINHLAVEVGDVDEAIAFFERIFDDVTLRGRGGNMAFVDMGDQFVALEAVARPVSAGHIGLVVDDQAEALSRAREAGATMVGAHDFRDPWGNQWQVVDYRDIQFSKASAAWTGCTDGLEVERAVAELRKGSRTDQRRAKTPSCGPLLSLWAPVRAPSRKRQAESPRPKRRISVHDRQSAFPSASTRTRRGRRLWIA